LTEDREARCRRFLESAGWGEAERRVLAADASFRRYDRLTRGADRAVLMDAPPPQENAKVFHDIACCLLDIELSAPRPLAIDDKAGFLLLEDFGDRTFTRALKEGADEAELYRLATDTLVALHQRWWPDVPGLPPYDEERLLAEVALLVDWYLPAMTGQETPPAQRESYLTAWREVVPAMLAVPHKLVLRDYHVDNLMVVEGRAGIARCGLLDFQDAVIGPISYDLVSLLEDARRDVSPDVVAPADRPLGLRRLLCRARCPAQRQDHRHLHPPVAPRRQARLPAAHPPRLAPAGGRPAASRSGTGEGLVRP
jgi:hypothetical protein